MTEQLIFDLPFRTAMGRADYYISEANAAAVGALDTWRDWPSGKMLLIGGVGSGKTHLAHVFAEQSGAWILAADAITDETIARAADLPALVVEDADQIAGHRVMEERLFHVHNALQHTRAPLLISAATPPARWGLTLPDLLSRMQQAGQIALPEPDDTLMAAVMVKLCQDRGLVLPIKVMNFALLRLSRSMAAVGAFVAALDKETLSAGEKPGIKHAKAVLARLDR